MNLAQRVINRVVPDDWQAHIAMFSEAMGRVGREYKDLAAAQGGEIETYVVAIWLGGLTRADFNRLKIAFGSRSMSEPWDSAAIPRNTAFIVVEVEAPNPERAGVRCLDALTDRITEVDIRPEAVRVECEARRVLEAS